MRHSIWRESSSTRPWHSPDVTSRRSGGTASLCRGAGAAWRGACAPSRDPLARVRRAQLRWRGYSRRSLRRAATSADRADRRRALRGFRPAIRERSDAAFLRAARNAGGRRAGGCASDRAYADSHSSGLVRGEAGVAPARRRRAPAAARLRDLCDRAARARAVERVDRYREPGRKDLPRVSGGRDLRRGRVVGRAAGGRDNFAAHGFVACASLSAIMVAGTLSDYLSFGLDSGWLDYVGIAAAVGIFAYMIYRHLRLNSRSSRRWLAGVSAIASLAVSVALAGLQIASDWSLEGKLPYDRTIKAPGFLWVSGVPATMFLARAVKLKSQADALAKPGD